MIEKFDKLKDSDVHVSPPHSAAFKTAVVGAYLSSFLFEKNSSEQALFLLAIPWGHLSWLPAAQPGCAAEELRLCRARWPQWMDGQTDGQSGHWPQGLFLLQSTWMTSGHWW